MSEYTVFVFHHNLCSQITNLPEARKGGVCVSVGLGATELRTPNVSLDPGVLLETLAREGKRRTAKKRRRRKKSSPKALR